MWHALPFLFHLPDTNCINIPPVKLNVFPSTPTVLKNVSHGWSFAASTSNVLPSSWQSGVCAVRTGLDLGYQFRGKMPQLLTPMLATMSLLSNPKDLSGSVCALQLSVGHRGSQPAVMETVSCQAFPRNGTLSCQHWDCVPPSAYLKYHS